MLKGIYLPQYIQYEWMGKFQINTFIDIGAHDGNISRVINYMFPQSTIFAFEPLKQKRDLIKSKIGPGNLIVETLALSNHVGSKNFYEYDYPAASSFLKPNLERKDFTKKIAKTYSVRITTLDKYFDKKKLKKPIFGPLIQENAIFIKKGELAKLPI